MAASPPKWVRWLSESVTANQSAPAAVSATPFDNVIVVEGCTGMRIRPVVGADGQAATLALYGIDVDDPMNPTMYTSVIMFAAVAITGGTQLGVGDLFPQGGEVFCDTIVAPTASAFMTEFSQYQIPNVGTGLLFMDEFSPADNTFSELFIRGINSFWGILPVIAALSSESGNLLYKLDAPPNIDFT